MILTTNTLVIHVRNWWPFFVTLFYLLSPLPTVLARRYQDDVGSSNACKEMALFLTAGIVISAYGLPLVLARSGDPTPVVSFSNEHQVTSAIHNCCDFLITQLDFYYGVFRTIF